MQNEIYKDSKAHPSYTIQQQAERKNGQTSYAGIGLEPKDRYIESVPLTVPS
jgi:hypothetical protein